MHCFLVALQALAEAQGFFFLETSVLDGSNVQQAFTEIIQQVCGLATLHRGSLLRRGVLLPYCL